MWTRRVNGNNRISPNALTMCSFTHRGKAATACRSGDSWMSDHRYGAAIDENHDDPYGYAMAT
jgi:hypothetical protein